MCRESSLPQHGSFAGGCLSSRFLILHQDLADACIGDEAFTMLIREQLHSTFRFICFDESFIVWAWHDYVDIIIPRYESLVSYCTQKSAIGNVIVQIVFRAEIMNIL